MSLKQKYIDLLNQTLNQLNERDFEPNKYGEIKAIEEIAILLGMLLTENFKNRATDMNKGKN